MQEKIFKIDNYGFSILEMTVVLIIMSILLSAVIPVLSRGYLEKAANKTTLDMFTIQEASRKFFIDNKKWPSATTVDTTPMAVLQDAANGYLPPTTQWNAINPFGSSAATPSNYSYIIQPPTSSLLTVCTYVPTAAQNIILNSLPASFIDTTGDSTNGDVCSYVSSPGATTPVVPTGTIFAYYAGSGAPTGFLLCDGTSYPSSSYQDLANLLNAGSGASSFTVPDLRGRTIVGLNRLTSSDGTNRIWSTDTYSNNQGQSVSYNVNQLGGVFGEEAHRQTVPEMARHSHDADMWRGGGEPSSTRRFSASYTLSELGLPYAQTNSTGGIPGDTSDSGAPSNVVQPSMAMEYIIKT